jgi:hypothetical protein
MATQISPPPNREADANPVLVRLTQLRALAQENPYQAREQGWVMLVELGRQDDRKSLHELWLAGDAPSSPPGHTLGKNLGRVHSVELAWLKNLALKRDPWTGKTIGENKGYNRLERRAYRTVKLLSRRAPWFEGNEVAGFPFDVKMTTGAIEPHRAVLAIDYSSPRHGNPMGGLFPFGRIRDEVVELLDGLYVARVLLRVRGGYRHIGAFCLRRNEE